MAMLLPSFLVFATLPLRTLPQQITSPIETGSTLSTNNSTWVSPSGDFAFGFCRLNETSYLLSIWYTNIPDTLVWYAGADGVLASEGSMLTCTVDGGLVLKDPQGSTLWSANISSANTCVLNDSGNFMIKGKEGDTLWQSFDDPRDTLLPSQKIGSLGSGGPKVYSRRSKSDFTRGKFQMRLLDDGNLVLNTRNLVTDFAYDRTYFVSDGTDDASNPGYMVNYDESGHMYIMKKNGGQVDLLDGKSIPSPNNYYFRATLNYDGVLVWYYHDKNITSGTASSWNVIAWQPDDICSSKISSMDSGVCGFNSICRINNNGDYSSPTCECPPRYSLVDPNYAFGDCKPDFSYSADNEDIGRYKLEKLAMTDWPERDYYMRSPVSEDECKNSCLNDTNCVAVIFSGQTCWKKGSQLINGRTDTTRTAFLKVSDANDDGIILCWD